MNRNEATDIEILIKDLIAPSNRIILCVEEFADGYSQPALQSRDNLLEIIQQFDPTFARTIFVYTKFHLFLHSMVHRDELHRQLVIRLLSPLAAFPFSNS